MRVVMNGLRRALGDAATLQDDGCEDGSGGKDGHAVKYSWVIAVALCVLSAFVINFGTNLQKLAWNRRKEARSKAAPEDASATYASLPSAVDLDAELADENEAALPQSEAMSGAEEAKFRRLWILGFACIVVGSLFDFAALAFGAQSIVAPLGSVSLVANMGFAQLMHGEKLSRRDIVATAVIIMGCILAVAFASHKNEICDIDTLLGLYQKPRFAVYATVILSLLAGGYSASRYFERVDREFGPSSSEYMAIHKYHRFVYSFLSGVAGAQSVLFAKSLDELLVSSFSGDSRIFLAHFGSYLIAFCMFSSIGLQIYWLNCALARWDALYVVPVFQAQWIVFSVVGGGVFYGEFAGFSFGQGIAFLLGVSCTVLGVYFLSQRGTHESDADSPGAREGVEGLTPRLGSRRHLGHPAARLGKGFVGDSDSDAAFDHFERGELASLDTAQAQAQAAQRHRLDESLDTPLLDSVEASQARQYSSADPTRGAPAEYEVTFEDDTIGLSVGPITVQSASGAAVQLWCVRASRLGPDSPVQVGHCIVAVDGYSVVGPAVRLPAVLTAISRGPRPMTLRFRVEPTAAQPALRPHSRPSSARLRSGKGSIPGSAASVEDAAGAELTPLERASPLPAAPRRQALQELGEGSEEGGEGSGDDFDEESDERAAMGHSHASLKSVEFNPLLGLIHTWGDSGPSAYDKLAREQDEASASPFASATTPRSTRRRSHTGSLGAMEGGVPLGSRGRERLRDSLRDSPEAPRTRAASAHAVDRDAPAPSVTEAQAPSTGTGTGTGTGEGEGESEGEGKQAGEHEVRVSEED